MKSTKETLFEELDRVYFTRLMENVDLMAELYGMKKTNSSLENSILCEWHNERRDEAEAILERICSEHGWTIAEYDAALYADTLAHLEATQ